MALGTIDWRSDVLGKWTTMHVLIPERCDPPFATLYLLHGMSDDYTIWLRQTRIEMYARRWPLLVVMPDGYRGFYTDNANGPAYARHFGEELVRYIERLFPVRRDRAGRGVSGLSMGGYGALRLALGYPNVFGSATCHSGAPLHGAKRWKRKDAEMRRVFGPGGPGTDHDLLRLARRAQAARRLPKLRLDCGTEDFLIEDNRAFHQQLSAASVPHEYFEFPGAHSWDYWDLHIQEALEFHGKHMGLTQLKPW